MNIDYKVKFSGRAHKYTRLEIDTVIGAMQSDETLTQGKHLLEFQKKFCDYNGVENSFALCNATAALEIAAQLCQFEEGDEVIIPSHTFTASAYPFVKKGAMIRWADIDPETRVVTADTIKLHITSKTKAIVVVHLYGYLSEMPAIMELAKSHRILVIEDTAQAMGTEIDGRKAGSFGDIGIFSFHSHKNITTLGEGGMITVKSMEYARIVPMLRHNGHTTFPFDREDYWLPAMGNVDYPELNGKLLQPNNYCLGEIECALGTVLLDRLDQMNAEKRKRALEFIDALNGLPELKFHKVDSTRHNYHLLVAEVGDGLRNQFIRKMANEKKIQCVVQYYPLNRYPFYQKSGFGAANCPNADQFFDNMVSFPFQHWMSEDDLKYVIDSAKEVILELRK